jgi:SpoVK/Ycf46/Vps4 family AAA+-type ATPase
VLLRVLEYFQGIMFLTTNRVSIIDAALISRIHLSVMYPPLSPEARCKRWETFVLKGNEQHRPRWLTPKFLQKLSMEDVNGREIKNIVRLAHALSMSDKRLMQSSDILQGLQSLKVSLNDLNQAVGKRHLDEHQGHTSSKKAKSHNLQAPS